MFGASPFVGVEGQISRPVYVCACRRDTLTTVQITDFNYQNIISHDVVLQLGHPDASNDQFNHIAALHRIITFTSGIQESLEPVPLQNHCFIAIIK